MSVNRKVRIPVGRSAMLAWEASHNERPESTQSATSQLTRPALIVAAGYIPGKIARHRSVTFAPARRRHCGHGFCAAIATQLSTVKGWLDRPGMSPPRGDELLVMKQHGAASIRCGSCDSRKIHMTTWLGAIPETFTLRGKSTKLRSSFEAPGAHDNGKQNGAGRARIQARGRR